MFTHQGWPNSFGIENTYECKDTKVGQEGVFHSSSHARSMGNKKPEQQG
jgi:hypothetical protein